MLEVMYVVIKMCPLHVSTLCVHVLIVRVCVCGSAGHASVLCWWVVMTLLTCCSASQSAESAAHDQCVLHRHSVYLNFPKNKQK